MGRLRIVSGLSAVSVAFALAVFVPVLSAGCSEAKPEENAANLPRTEGLPQAIDHDALFVVNGGDNSISIIDTESNTFYQKPSRIILRNSSFPHYLTMTADKTKLLLTAGEFNVAPGAEIDAGDVDAGPATPGAVILMNATTGVTLKGRYTDGANHNAVFGPLAPVPQGAPPSTETEIWAGQRTDPGTVLVMNSTNLVTKTKVDVGKQPARVSISHNGRYAFVVNSAENSVTAIDTATKLVAGTIAVGRNPIGAWQGANNFAYVNNAEDKTLTAIDVITLDVKRTYELGFTPGTVAYGPDGNLWVTDVDNGKIVLFEAGTTLRITGFDTVGDKPGVAPYAIAFSGNGQTVYVSNTLDNSVSFIDIPTRRVRKVITVGLAPNWLLWRSKGPGSPLLDGGR